MTCPAKIGALCSVEIKRNVFCGKPYPCPDHPWRTPPGIYGEPLDCHACDGYGYTETSRSNLLGGVYIYTEPCSTCAATGDSTTGRGVPPAIGRIGQYNPSDLVPLSRGAIAYQNCVNPDCLAEEGDRHYPGCTPEKATP